MSAVETECIRKRKRNNEIEETNDSIFDSVFYFFMDFANKADTIVPHPRELLDSDEEVEAPLDMFEKLEVEDQEDVIKEVFGEIVWNLLGKLPIEGKKAFLAKCFKELSKKLPRECQVEISAKVKEKSATLDKETARPTTRDLSGYFPTGGRRLERNKVRPPNVVREEDPNAGNGGPNRRGVGRYNRCG